MVKGGYVPQWTTTEMDAGTETVYEHLISGHGQPIAMVEGLSLDDANKLHDQLHNIAGHTRIFDIMEEIGALRSTLP